MKIIIKVSEGSRFSPVDADLALKVTALAINHVEYLEKEGIQWCNGTVITFNTPASATASISRLPTGYSVQVWKYPIEVEEGQ